MKIENPKSGDRVAFLRGDPRTASNVISGEFSDFAMGGTAADVKNAEIHDLLGGDPLPADGVRFSISPDTSFFDNVDEAIRSKNT